MPGRERRTMARPITSRLNPAPVRRMMARPVGEVGPLARLPIGFILAAGAAVLVVVIVLLATRGNDPAQDVAGGRSGAAGELPVTIRFGTAIDPVGGEVIDQRTTFVPGEAFAYSIRLPEPVGADEVEVEVIHRGADGAQQVVQAPSGQPVERARRVIAFEVTADALIQGFGTGDFQMRIYRGRELIAQGSFTLAPG